MKPTDVLKNKTCNKLLVKVFELHIFKSVRTYSTLRTEVRKGVPYRTYVVPSTGTVVRYRYNLGTGTVPYSLKIMMIVFVYLVVRTYYLYKVL